MNWEVRLAGRAVSFLEKNHVSEERIGVLIRSAVRKFEGERVAIDMKKMKGEWSGFYRIRKGELRMIVAFDFDAKAAFIEAIDWRGNIY